jgi:hypothetical protein
MRQEDLGGCVVEDYSLLSARIKLQNCDMNMLFFLERTRPLLWRRLQL